MVMMILKCRFRLIKHSTAGRVDVGREGREHITAGYLPRLGQVHIKEYEGSSLNHFNCIA